MQRLTLVPALLFGLVALPLAAPTAARAVCGDSIVDPGEQCDGDPCCEATCTFRPAGVFCGSLLADDCNRPDICDAAGACLPNHTPQGTVAPTLCNDANVCTADECNGTGGCQNPPEFTGFFCGDMLSDGCNRPDICDAGACTPNHTPQGTVAPTLCNDANVCTADECNGNGGCQNPAQSTGFLCGDMLSDGCNRPDICDGAGSCTPNHTPAGTVAPTLCDDANGCTADLCDGTGGCQNPPELPGFRCDDGDVCLPDACDGTGNCAEAEGCGDGVADTVCGEFCDGSDLGLCGATGGCAADCSCCPQLVLTTLASTDSCGILSKTVDDASPSEWQRPYGQAEYGLNCNTMYIGGRRSRWWPAQTPVAVSSVFRVTDCADDAALVLGPSTATDTGGDAGRCTSAGCGYGAPTPVVNGNAPAQSACLVSTFTADAAGFLDAQTGNVDVTLPLAIDVHITGDLDPAPGTQPCPLCTGGTCSAGPNAGGACTPAGPDGTSADCPPAGAVVATLDASDATISTTPLVLAEASGIFCPGAQRDRGAFGARPGRTRYIETAASAFGDLRDGAPHSGVVGDVFCVPRTGVNALDRLWNIEGAAAWTMSVQAELLP